MNSDIQILNAHLPLRLSLFANSPTVPAKITYQQSIPGRMQNNSDIDIMKTFLALQGLIVEMQETSSSFVNIQAFVSCLSVNCHPVNFFQVNPDYQRTTKPLIAPLRADEAKDEQKEDTRRLQRNLAKFIPLIHLLKDIALLSPDAATILSSHGLSIRISDFLSGKRSPSRSTQSQAEITLLTEDDCQIPPKDEEHAKAALGALLCTTVVKLCLDIATSGCVDGLSLLLACLLSAETIVRRIIDCPSRKLALSRSNQTILTSIVEAMKES
ncbi:hypothetical protein BLNAU_21543 [Blattamonas nauphoetae]|uniref:Uncharacterized protein n=1 Tax=Blattamonas nauphoetae TaxID=2049346 RepID=A0ABQ9WYP8_9EUKA|nr:hypothetical protein BLNAU_21543 [Blattamonas nauphoetae]